MYLSRKYIIITIEQKVLNLFSGYRLRVAYLAEVCDGEVHPGQLFPHRLRQVQTQRAACADGDAQEHTCTDIHQPY